MTFILALLLCCVLIGFGVKNSPSLESRYLHSVFLGAFVPLILS